MQNWQMLISVAPRDDDQDPGGHERHEAVEFAATVLEYVPSGHKLHVADVDAPREDDHDPAKQGRHRLVDCAETEDHVPALHNLHAVLDEAASVADQVPEGQLEHDAPDELPANVEYVPAMHAKQDPDEEA